MICTSGNETVSPFSSHSGDLPTANVIGVALGGAVIGAAMATVPLVATAVAAIVVGLIIALVLVTASRVAVRLPGLFLACLGFVLAGYAFGGRTFAYLGYPPVFVGECLLAFGFLVVLLTPARSWLPRSSVALGLMAFIFWGVARTLPFLHVAGANALRDAVVYGYALFALLAAACLMQTGGLPSAVRWYGRGIPLFVLWVPCAFGIRRLAGEQLPQLPWADVELVSLKPGDVGVHLAGAAVFLLLGLGAMPGSKGTRATTALQFVPWLVACFITVSQSRGAMVGLATALLLAGLLHPRTVGVRVGAAGAVVIAAALVVLLVSDSDAQPSPEVDRVVSLTQVAENIRSITGSSDRGNLDGTREWRITWWSDILSYTVHGDYFWGGRGFGVNLADEDGFQVVSHDNRSDFGALGEAPLRSPHNINLTVLARAGVPGALLWLLLNAAFVVSMIAGHVRCRLADQAWWAAVCTWVLAYWMAMIVNGSFDVYIEGPPGGIWFWSTIGAGIAALEGSRQARAYVRHPQGATL